MMTPIAFGALCFSSLFTVLDPVGVAPVFASMTAGKEARERRRLVLRACAAALAALALFALGGTWLLRLFGITIEAFRIAGGMLFGLLGLSMLGLSKLGALGASPHDAPSTDENSNDPGADISIVPIGIPLIGGPGAMTTVMVLVGQSETNAHLAVFVVALLAAIAVTGLTLVAAPALLRRLGPAGVALTTKLMGLIVLVIGVQFIIDGVSTVARRLLTS